MDKDKLIKSVRFKLAISFSIFLYLIFYICWLFPVGTVRDSIDSLIFLFVRNCFAFLISYFILYRKKTLDKFIFNKTTRTKVFLSQVFEHLFIGSLLLGFSAGGGIPGLIFMAPMGAFLGFIFGVISSVILIVIRERVK